MPRLGRTSHLTGRVTAGVAGVPACLEFLGGPNTGMVLACRADGTFEAILEPGFALLQISGPGVSRFVRELELPHGAEIVWEVDVAARRAINGRVRDEEGQALGEVKVSIDGCETRTDADGWFQCASAASGRPLLVAERPGYATYREALAGPLSREISRSPEVILQRGAELEIHVDRFSGEGDCVVYVVPEGGQRLAAHGGQPSFPWYRVNPARIAAGETLFLSDLPSGRIAVHAFHPLGSARSDVRHLEPGRRTRIDLELRSRPLLEGLVLERGEPLAGALVVLEAANRTRANIASLDASSFYRSMPVLGLPAARQETRADASGRFRLGDWRSVSGQSFLTVRSPDDTTRITRELVSSMDCTIDLASPIVVGSSLSRR